MTTIKDFFRSFKKLPFVGKILFVVIFYLIFTVSMDFITFCWSWYSGYERMFFKWAIDKTILLK